MMLKPSAAPLVNHSSIDVGDLVGRAGEREVSATAAQSTDESGESSASRGDPSRR